MVRWRSIIISWLNRLDNRFDPLEGSEISTEWPRGNDGCHKMGEADSRSWDKIFNAFSTNTLSKYIKRLQGILSIWCVLTYAVSVGHQWPGDNPQYCIAIPKGQSTILYCTVFNTALQCVTVPKMLNDTDTDTFFRNQIFSIPIPVLFPVPNFFRYRFRDFLRYQILPIPVPRLFSGTKFFRYRFRYHQKKMKNSRFRHRYPL